MKNKIINDHMKWAKDNGFCTQCIHPWFDGLCSCGNYAKYANRIDAITILALEELDEDWDKKRQKYNEQIKKRMKIVKKKTVDNPKWMTKLKDYMMSKMIENICKEDYNAN